MPITHLKRVHDKIQVGRAVLYRTDLSVGTSTLLWVQILAVFSIFFMDCRIQRLCLRTPFTSALCIIIALVQAPLKITRLLSSALVDCTPVQGPESCSLVSVWFLPRLRRGGYSVCKMAIANIMPALASKVHKPRKDKRAETRMMAMASRRTPMGTRVSGVIESVSAL